MDEFEKYEQDCKAIVEENERLLEIFAEDLQSLKPQTIARHVDHVEFYLNTYLLRMGAYDFTYGIGMIDDYLGNFFIRRCMWSTPGNIKSTAASIKKFYKSMLKHERILKTDYDTLCETIKENMWMWQNNCEIYNDPDAENPFFMF